MQTDAYDSPVPDFCVRLFTRGLSRQRPGSRIALRIVVHQYSIHNIVTAGSPPVKSVSSLVNAAGAA